MLQLIVVGFLTCATSSTPLQPHNHDISNAMSHYEFPLTVIQHTNKSATILNQHHRRGLKSLAISGSAKWYFVTSVQFGQPAQTISMMVDTGSADILIGGISEAKVAHGYNPLLSSTARSTGNTFNQHYLDSMASGTIYKEQLVLSNNQRIAQGLDFEISVTEQSQNLFFHEETFDVVLGLGPAGSTSTGHEPLLDTLVRNQRIQDTIGMMLCNEDASGSKLTLAARATDTSSAQRIFKTDMGVKRHYTVKLLSMAINNILIDVPCGAYNSPGDTGIDSGTTEIVLPHAVHTQFRTTLATHFPRSMKAKRDSLFAGEVFYLS